MEFPAVLVHPDLPGVEIVAATRTSLRAHRRSGWRRAGTAARPPDHDQDRTDDPFHLDHHVDA